MIPTVIIPLIDNERLPHYEELSKRAVASVEHQTVVTPYIVSKADTLSEAKNSGVAKAGTEACMLLDADDVIHRDFMRAVDRVDEWDVIKPRVYVNGILNVFPERDIRQMNHLINGCPFKTELYEDVGGFEEGPYDDWYFWAKVLIKHDPNIVYVRDAIYHYIQTDEGLNLNHTSDDLLGVRRRIMEYEECLNS